MINALRSIISDLEVDHQNGIVIQSSDASREAEILNQVSTLDALDDYQTAIAITRDLRSEWGLIVNPIQVKAPSRAWDFYKPYIDETVTDPSKRNDWVTADSPVCQFRLNDDEVMGELLLPSEEWCKVISDQIIVGKNAPRDELLVVSRYSQTLLPKEGEIKRVVRASVPQELVAAEGETQESMLEKQLNSTWLDEIHKHGKKTLANGDPK